MENVELVDIYKILLSMQQDIHKLDKKVDNIDMRLTKLEQSIERFFEIKRYNKVCESDDTQDYE